MRRQKPTCREIRKTRRALQAMDVNESTRLGLTQVLGVSSILASRLRTVISKIFNLKTIRTASALVAGRARNFAGMNVTNIHERKFALELQDGW
jgi:hypothetical protein